MELPDIAGIARSLSDIGKKSRISGYSAVLATLNADECRELGERYMSQTRIQRKTAAPFFIDKMPNNFAHIDLIQLALPHAKIIDARRHPLGCCFSGFKQHFARGQGFHLQLGGYRPVLSGLRGVDGFLRCGSAGPDSSSHL